MGVLQLLIKIKLVSRCQGSLFHQVEDLLSIDDALPAVVEVHARTEELFYQQGYVKLEDAKSRQVGSFEEPRVFPGHILECGFVLYVFVVYTVDERRLQRNGDGGVDEV